VLNKTSEPKPCALALPLVALGTLLLALGVIYWQFEPLDCGSCDTGIYLSGAQSLAEGRGYKYVAYAGEPRITLYPPGQSLWLSLFWRMKPEFPENIPFLYCGMILLALGVIGVLCAYWWRERMPWPGIGLLILAWSFSSLWCWQLGTFFSDVLFGLLWLGIAWCWVGAENWDEGRRWLVTGGLVAVMYLTRTAALAPLGALAAVVGWRVLHGRGQPALAYLVPPLAALVLWKLFTAGHVTYGETFKSRVVEEGGWGGMVVYCGKLFIDYASGACFLGGLFPSLMELPSIRGLPAAGMSVLTALLMLCGWAFMALSIGGWWRSRTVADRLLGVMVFAFLAELVAWPFDIGSRCVFAVLPFVLLWAWRGLAALIA
jgi:hypothetical protein